MRLFTAKKLKTVKNPILTTCFMVLVLTNSIFGSVI